MVLIKPSKETLLTSKDQLYVICNVDKINLDNLEIKIGEEIGTQGKFVFNGFTVFNKKKDFDLQTEYDQKINGLFLKKDIQIANTIEK